MIEPLPGIGRDDIDRSVRSLWRYQAALPISMKPISLGEGCTPLVEKIWRGNSFLFKLEWFAPTGSFKDKGASVLVSLLRQQSIDRFLEDSSGNGGAALAAYGAAAGLGVRIVTPAYTQPAKVVQMRAFGADVQLIPGNREASAEEAIRQSQTIFYASHNWHPFFLQGTKMTAYEIWEDLGFSAPDNVVVPVGAGSNVLGCEIGFSELKNAGQIARLPRIFGVQPENCAPIAAAVAQSNDPFTAKPTMAEGASIANPIRLPEVVAAARKTGGGIVAVSESEIESALFELAELGLFVEPTSALTAAALNRLIASGAIAPDETTVVLLTATGIKSLLQITELTASREAKQSSLSLPA